MDSFSKVCICGGGNVAHVLAAVLGNNRGISVRLLTRKPALWKREIEIDYKEKAVLRGKLDAISNNAHEVAADADLILITVPTFAYAEIWDQLKDVIRPDAVIGAFAGNGGFEWITHKHPGLVFGMQRIPYVCRILNYGESVRVSGVRPQIFIGSRPAFQAKKLAEILSDLLQLTVLPLANYLGVALAPTNPIMHSVRMYGIFKALSEGKEIKFPILFYQDWDDLSSSLYLLCDAELQAIYQALLPNGKDIVSIRQHYQTEIPTELSRVISEITSLSGIQAPVIADAGGTRLDLDHRFFTEDVLLNLSVYQHLASLAEVEIPTINRIAEWGQKLHLQQNNTAAVLAVDYATSAGVNSLAAVQKFYTS